ncbi:MAG: activase, partial [Spirochaetaceae bacterium]
HETPFTCAGGKEKCDLKCSISRIRIEGQLFPFGGACNRYYNKKSSFSVDEEKFDFVKKRTDLVFGKYAPIASQPATGPVIGINRSFLVHRLFPFFYNYFTTLGCRVVSPSEMNDEALNRQTSSMCFPAQIAIGMFDKLTQSNPDYYFMPHIEEMHVPGGNTRKEFSTTCLFIQGEAFWMRQIFKDKQVDRKMLAPTINFSGGWERGRKQFLEIAGVLGFDKKKSDKAFDKACAMQDQFEEELRKLGRQALEQLHSDPAAIATVILGRPYNAMADEANKGIPKKIATRGHMVIPFDMLPWDKEPIAYPHDDYLHWEIGNQLLRASQLVKRDPQLYGVFITNFLCAIDSLLVTYFRKMMGTKPSLTLELDGHTADAGVNTRIDAFLDIIHNYLKVQKEIGARAIKTDFVPAVAYQDNTGIVFVGSDGKRFPLKHPRVKMIIPSMGDLANTLFAAVFHKLGITAIPMQVADTEILRLGRGVTTCKECLPMIVCIGTMLKYLETRKDPDEKLIVFQPRAAGYCRLGQYHAYMNMMIREREIKDMAVLALANEERYSGFGPTFAFHGWEAIVVSDVMDDIRNTM